MRKIFTLMLACLSSIAFSQSTTVVISQVYGGGGGATGTYNADYVELHNISDVSQDISGFKILYGSSAGNLASTASNAFTFPTGVIIPAGGYYLVATAPGTGLANLPVTPDQIFTLVLSGTNGKVAFGNANMINNTALSGQPAGSVIDFVGYGSASEFEGTAVGVLSATTAALRNNNGCAETNNNFADFTIGSPTPRNSSTTTVICSASPANPSISAGQLNNFGSVTILTNSVAQTTNISGANLTGAPGNITATSSSAEFQVSIDNISWASSVNISYTSATLAITSLYVRFTPQSIGIKTGSITISGGGVSTPVILAVNGNGATSTPLAADHIVISQLYGAGGNSGALLNADFVELHNRSGNAVSLAGHSIQYSSSATTGSWSGKSLLPAVTIPAGGYFLIQMSATGTIGAALPTPDHVASPAISMSQTNGRVALVSDTVNVYGCPNTFNMVDLVGYGTSVCFETVATAALDTLNAALRNNNGCDDTDNNQNDFTIGTPAPRNSATPVNLCNTTQPSISASTLTNFGSVLVMTASTGQTFTLSGSNLTGAPGLITIAAPGPDFQVSVDGINWFSSVTVPYTSASLATTTLYVRFTPQTAGTISGNISISGGGLISSVTVLAAGTGTNPAMPTLTAGTVNDFGSVTILTNSTSQSFSVSGTDLTGAPGLITITAPSADFEVSNDNAIWGGSTSIAYTSSTLASTLVYVRFSPQSVGLKTGNISISGGGVSASVTVAVSGTGISGTITGGLMISQVYGAGGNPGATLNADYVELHNSSNVTQSLSGMSIQYGSATNAGAFSGVAALPAATIPPGGYYLIQMSATGTAGTALPTPDHVASPAIAMSAKQAKVALVNGTTPLPGCPAIGQVIDLVGYGVTNCSETSPTDTLAALRAAFRNNNGCDDTDNNLNDFTIGLPAPRNSASPIYLCNTTQPVIAATALANFGNVLMMTASTAQTFTITGSNLTGAPGVITISSPSVDFQVSTDGINWSASVTVPYTSASLASTTIYVRFTPQTTGALSGNVSITGGGLSTSVNVAVAGTGINAATPTLTAGTLNDFGNVTILTNSTSQSFAVSGTDLTGAPGFISISAPGADFQVSNDNAIWAASTTIAYTSSTLASTLVYVRFTPQSTGLKTGNISITGGGVSTAVTVAVSGTGTSGTVSGRLMISQVYGAGGNPGATLNADYIELHNSSNVTQSLAGLSIQYGSATNAGAFSGVAALPNATIPPGGYYLIQMSATGASGTALPTPDHVAAPTISMSAKQAKVALVNGTTALPGCPTIGQVVDLVGYGVTNCSETAPTDTLAVLRAAFRNNNGCDDTDNNLNDFTIGTPAPRNSATPIYLCVPAGPNITTTALTAFGAVCVSTTAGPNSFSISGTNLNAGDITVSPLNGYTYATSAAGPYSASLTLPNAGGSFAQTIYVQFNPAASGNYDGNIAVNGGGIASPIQVAVSGSAATNVPPVVNAGTATAVTTTGATVPGVITSQGCGVVTAYGVEYSTTPNFSPGSGTAVPATNLSAGNFSVTLSSLQPGTTYYFITYATNANGTVYSTVTSFNTVALTPQLNTTSLNAFGDVCLGDSSATDNFNIVGVNLTSQNITVGPLGGFVFSTNPGGPFTASLTLTATAGTLNQTIYVKFAPAVTGTINSNIRISGGGLTNDVLVAAAANAISTPPSVSTENFEITGQTTANLSGKIQDQGCDAVTERGIEYSGVNGFVNGQGTKVIASSGAGQDFTSSLSGLVPGATYYYKAYASSSSGTGYGAQVSFTMPSLNAGLTIYNNPINQGGLLHYSYNPINPGHYSVKIYNLLGQLVYQKDLVIQVGFINDEVNLPSTFTPGRYVLQIENDQFRRRKSFLIQ